MIYWHDWSAYFRFVCPYHAIYIRYEINLDEKKEQS